MSDIAISGRRAIMTEERYQALGTSANRQLDVVNAAQALNLPVHGAAEFTANDFDALDEDRQEGIYFSLVFAREAEPVVEEDAELADDEDDAEVEADLMEALGFGEDTDEAPANVEPLIVTGSIEDAEEVDFTEIPLAEEPSEEATREDEELVADAADEDTI